MSQRKMHLVAFLLTGPTSHHHGMWRHPETENRFLDPAAWEHIARVLEHGKFDSLFFADILGIYDFLGGSYATLLGKGGQMGLLDPLPLLAIMARATSHIGLGATVSTSFSEPFNVARIFGSIDHISGGRAAWNVVTSSNPKAALNFNLDEHIEHERRYERANEFVDVVRGLWDC